MPSVGFSSSCNFKGDHFFFDPAIYTVHRTVTAADDHTMAEASKAAVVPWRQWAFANFTSLWFVLAPLASLLAAYAPRRLFQTYFNLFLRRRVLNVVDPYATIDISDTSSDVRYSRYGRVSDTDTTYEEVKAYLSEACLQQEDARELRAEGAKDGDALVDVADEFRGASLWWSSVVEDDVRDGFKEKRRFHRLTFHLRHRRLVVDEYLPHILFTNRRRTLYTNSKSRGRLAWSYIDFDHPTTFDTLAMDRAKKKDIMDDLDAFRNNKEFYRRTGKPWKRGYLLYGPPGTGKSTMVAAMANYLDYDIYDVELTVVKSNTDLRKLLIETTSKSIVVIEDIDCTLDLTGDRSKQQGRRPKNDRYDDDKDRSMVTLSGLLNFIDGLWSACGGERIVVFTTNHADKLDPALIRRGRMDMHIEMSYCGFKAFQTLAKNYLDIDGHESCSEAKLTPADVAECLMKAKRAAGSGEPSTCMQVLIRELEKRAEEKAKAEAEAEAKARAEAEAAMAEADATEMDPDNSREDRQDDARTF
ncbi:hypothetical protein HU200_061445 [Digitaria exilis]|uniref:AAA+ ATPase domain-containing protein n=1 Tax=Digitaria exilis TaxID=1010633 RepID=A0A835AHC0_9POAL|nr:hypothetical protein HU200_061445 [Digitaria exilis]